MRFNKQIMENINSSTKLRASILELENRHTQEGKMLKEQFNVAYESIKPVNLIKNTLKEAVNSQDLKENLISTTVGLTAGYLSKIFYEAISNRKDKEIIGSALQQNIQKIVTNNPDLVKSLGIGFLKIITPVVKSKNKIT